MEPTHVVGTATTELDRNTACHGCGTPEWPWSRSRRTPRPSHAIQDKPRGQVVGGNLPVVLTKLTMSQALPW